MQCQSCHAELSDDARFCPKCGTPSGTGDRTVQKPASSPVSSSSSGSLKHGRFLPGAILGERFRIVALLGRGGMGEVFRADDLKLGQSVALKFLPPEMSKDRQRLERLYSEVRIARQIAHPSVCRVYDVGEVDGEHFISMEYIEGEDLSTLLRRIGGLPETKALQIARQVAAGVAAAHEKGVLHRDLKPSNIMLDERGVARITDFGLAAVHSDLGKANIAEGTPAYMAPEQLAGKDVSARSDIYSLGLVLYELFTGKRAFDAGSTAAVIKQRQTLTPATPSTVSPDVNPAIERVILHCLEAEPNNRPPSALAVAAALPGGDPLAAALAAGETPSPELLAAAGTSLGMRPSYALACIAAVVVGMLVVAAANDYAGLFTTTFGLQRSPEQLAAKSREIATRLGYKEQTHAAYGFEVDNDFITYVRDHDKTATRWNRLSKGHPTAIHFWYRESPRPLIPTTMFNNGRVTQNDPTPAITGMVTLVLQPDGVLQDFRAVSPQMVEDAPAKAVEWRPLLDFAALDPSHMQPAKSRWTPLAWGDQRAAWTGKSPEQPDIAIRLEAAGFQGKPISFRTIFPWTKPTRDVETSSGMTAREKAVAGVLLGIAAVLFIIAAFLARRNFRLGRGDRRGAFRFGLALASLRFVSSMFRADHVFATGEFVIILSALSSALLIAALGWLLYIGIEPYVRRRWPQTLVSWNRLMLGQLRDPLIGRDVLVGLTGASVLVALARVAAVIARVQPDINTTLLAGIRQSIGGVFFVLSLSFITSVGIYVLMFVLRVITRRDWIAAALFVLLNSLPVIFLVPEKWWLVGAISLIANGVAMFLLFRFGMVVLLAWNLAAILISSSPMTLHLSAWYGTNALFSAAVLLVITFWAFRISLAGRPLFSEALLET